ncbi:MAG: HD domain-containing protein [Nitrososphaerales archaeon]
MQKEGIINFIKLMGELKRIKRSGWVRKVDVKEPESVADHTFRTAILCMIIGDMKKLDTLKMLKMALIHDACESMIGDLMHYKDEREELQKRKLEDDAMLQILFLLPNDIRKNYSEIWRDFQDKESMEAKLVREIDKLEMVFQALEYEEEGYDKEKLSEFWDSAENSINDTDAKAIFDALKRQSKI